MAEQTEKKKLTVPDLIARKLSGKRVVMASITDYLMASWAERAGGERVDTDSPLVPPLIEIAA